MSASRVEAVGGFAPGNQNPFKMPGVMGNNDLRGARQMDVVKSRNPEPQGARSLCRWPGLAF
jgi:hypothetical protein